MYLVVYFSVINNLYFIECFVLCIYSFQNIYKRAIISLIIFSLWPIYLIQLNFHSANFYCLTFIDDLFIFPTIFLVLQFTYFHCYFFFTYSDIFPSISKLLFKIMLSFLLHNTLLFILVYVFYFCYLCNSFF